MAKRSPSPSPLAELREMRAQLAHVHMLLPRLGLGRGGGAPILENENVDENVDVDVLRESESASGDGEDADGGGGTKERERRLQSEGVGGAGGGGGGGGIPGLRVLSENVRQDIEHIDKFLTRHAHAHAAHKTTLNTSSFSTNAPYLIAIWNELTRAPGPVVFVEKTFVVPFTDTTTTNTNGNSSSNGSGNGNGNGKTKTRTSGKNLKKAGTRVKVDVGADNGRRWIRVNTIKNSRLLAEFRELDSYLTDSESDEDEDKDGEDECSAGCTCATKKPAPGPEELDNSLLQMGKSLLSAAQNQNFDNPEFIRPQITLRLTRLLLDEVSLSHLQTLGLNLIGPRSKSTTSDPSQTDPRIPQTIHELLKLGIDVHLGEHGFEIPAELISSEKEAQKPLLVSSRRVNLDLSVLIALVSDLTHAPLPGSAEEAHVRYIPTPAERARSRRRRQQQKELLSRAKAPNNGRGPTTKSSTRAPENKPSSSNSSSDDEGESVHSRALASQVIREMEIGLIDEIASRLELSGDADAALPIEFWTSKEARERCLRIIDKIGGPAEKRRASALFFCRKTGGDDSVLGLKFREEDEAVDAYWQDSRYPRNRVPGLVPLHIFEDEDGEILREDNTRAAPHSFWVNLEHSCCRLLSEGATPHPRSIPLSTGPSIDNEAPETTGVEDPSKVENRTNEIERAAVTRGNVRLTAHTVNTLRRGASRRWTTLTANRASVREMLKEIAKEANRVSLTKHVDDVTEIQNGVKARQVEVAAIWVIEPRSLAEGMRGDFKPENLV